MKSFFYLTVIFTFVIGCSSYKQDTTVINLKPSSQLIKYTGRLKLEEDSVTVFWPGSSISIRFKGNSVSAEMRDELGLNYFNVIIDGDSLHYIKLDTVKRTYVLAKDLADGEHTLELIKRTEWDKGSTRFYGFQVEGQALAPPAPNERVIEFFGNSITAGYAIENYTGGDSPDSIFTNGYYSYAAITARHFKADYYCTSKSGIGITISWFPLIMSEMYGRLDPRDSTSRWDFKKVVPDVVVINLFQNDSWLVNKPEHISFKQRFGNILPDDKTIIEAYSSFVKKVRAVYPDAYIICALGCMDAAKPGSPWISYVSEAVRQLNDEKVLAHFFPFMNKSGHPRREDNAAMAESLIGFIDENIKW